MKKSEMIYTRRVVQCNQTVAKSGDKKGKLKLWNMLYRSL